MKSFSLFIATTLFALNCLAAEPIFTLYNTEGSKPAADIKVMIRTLDGKLCYENKNISRFRYRTQIMPSEMTCQYTSLTADRVVVFVGYSQSSYDYQGSPQPSIHGHCTVFNEKDGDFGSKLWVHYGDGPK